MRIHRFYVANIDLKHDFWLHDEAMLHQWVRVLRFMAGQQVVLFDGRETERLYKIVHITPDEAHLQLVTDYVRRVPEKEIILGWSILKRDKNDWLMQKCTELGVNSFVPLLANRSEKNDLNLERSNRIVIEAAEQCGRSDIPTIREPMSVQSFIKEMKERSVAVFVCEQGSAKKLTELPGGIALLVGPEGGWDDREQQLFNDEGLQHISLGMFTLRAETAAVVASALAIRI